MSDRLRKNLIKYGSCVAAGLLGGYGYLSDKNLFGQALVDQVLLLVLVRDLLSVQKLQIRHQGGQRKDSRALD